MNRDDAQGEQGDGKRALTRAARPVRAFTLLELLVTISIITVLLSLLLPAINSAVAIARSRRCQAGQRAVGFDFSIFADETLHGFRGNNARANAFRLTSFIDAQYQVGDFWAWGDVDEVQMPDADGHDPMRCPEIDGPVTLIRGRQAYAGGIGPVNHLSFGFNIRLHQAEVRVNNGPPQLRQIELNRSVLDAGADNIPFMWDVDPLAAGERDVTPLLSGPSLGSNGVFANDRYWFPGQRHHSMGNYLFLDGHVAESANPLGEGWNWGYTPLAR